MRNRWLKFCKLSVLGWATAATLDGWAQVPIAISSSQALAFGSFVAGAGGTITITPAGARSGTGGVTLLPAAPGSAAQFSISGTSNASYSISLPPNDLVTLASGANTMAVNGFASSPAATGLLGLSGSQSLFVGATLSVGANQVPGNYSGNFTVSVNYN